MPNDVDLVRVTDAARRLGISRTKLYTLMRAGEIRFVKIGRCRRVRVRELMRFIERHVHGTP